MSRKPSPVPDQSTDFSLEKANAAGRSLTAVTAIDRRIMSTLHVGVLAGRMQTFNAFVRLGDLGLAKNFIQLRDALDAAGSIMLPGPDGEFVEHTNLDTLCEAVLGKSARRCRDFANRLEELGQEAYEAADVAGFKGRDYTALQELPDVDKEHVKRVLENKDGKAALELVHDLAAKQKSLAQKVQALESDVEGKQAFIDKQAKRLEKAESRGKWKPSKDTIARSEEEQALVNGVTNHFNAAFHEVHKLNEVAHDMLVSDNPAIRTRAKQSIEIMIVELLKLAQDKDIQLEIEGFEIPDWTQLGNI
jgi:hypothetical protein